MKYFALLYDVVRFWWGLEFLIHSVSGIVKREDEVLLALVLAEDPHFLDGVDVR